MTFLKIVKWPWLSGLELDRLDSTTTPACLQLSVLASPSQKNIWNYSRSHIFLSEEQCLINFLKSIQHLDDDPWLRHLTREEKSWCNIRSIWLMGSDFEKAFGPFGSEYPWDVVDNSSPQFWSRRIAKPWQARLYCCCSDVQAKVEQRPAKQAPSSSS